MILIFPVTRTDKQSGDRQVAEGEKFRTNKWSKLEGLELQCLSDCDNSILIKGLTT